MSKLTARKSFRHGRRTVAPGEQFDASTVDANYYVQYGFAERMEGEPEVEQPKRTVVRSERAYNRRDMRAEDELTKAADPVPRPVLRRRPGRPVSVPEATESPSVTVEPSNVGIEQPSKTDND